MIDARLLRPKQSGEPIRAEDWNAIIELLKREVRGPNVISDNLGWLLVDPVAEGGSTGNTFGVEFAEVISVAGVAPPYVITVQAVTPTGMDTFSEPSGDDFDLINESELGPSGSGVHKLAEGDIVSWWQVGGYRYCNHSNYRGTY